MLMQRFKSMTEQMKPSNSSCLDVKYFIDGRKHENKDIFSSVSDKKREAEYPRADKHVCV